VSFEEQATVLRENLAEVLEKEEEWSQAAQTLAGIDLDSGAVVVGGGVDEGSRGASFWREQGSHLGECLSRRPRDVGALG
jgi:hypothetical protein